MDNVKTNRKIRLKIVLVTLIVALAANAVLGHYLTKTSTANASTDPATFLSTRRGTKGDPVSDGAFAELDFQRNSDKFHYIEGSKIADLNDNFHNKTLREQSNLMS